MKRDLVVVAKGDARALARTAPGAVTVARTEPPAALVVAQPPLPAPPQRGPAAGVSQPSFVRAHRWALLAALLALVLAGGLAVRAWIGPRVATASVIRSDLVQTVVASGRVEAPHRLEVGAQIVGTVSLVPVVEGQRVQAGDLLVELEAAELAASGREADIAVAQAQARLRQLQEVQGPVAAQLLRQAESNLENARAALLRSRDLFARGFVGQAALDDARRTTELADAAVRSARMQFEATAADGSDRALARANVAGAEAGAQAAGARAAHAAIRAPVSGTLITRDVEVGDVVQPGKVLMTLSPQGRTQIVVAIDEKNLALLALGQGAQVSADAYPSERFEARLAYINPGIDAGTGAVEVKLDVAAPPAVLRQDMTVSVDIEVARRRGALILPLAAVGDADAAPWVLRLEGRHAVRRTVALGLRSAGLVEVLGGLSEGDVVLAAASGAEPGDRVRAQPAVAATPAG